MRNIFFLTAISLVLNQATFAYEATDRLKSEVDPFTQREKPIADATEALNKKGNEFLQTALKRANIKLNGESCDTIENEIKLYKMMRKYFRNQYMGKFTKWIVSTDQIEHNKLGVRETIYRSLNFFNSPIMGFYAKFIKDPTGEHLRLGDYYVGTDKFEHFHGTGYRYFEAHYLEGKSINETLEIGEDDEFGLLGAWSTGVVSYGDMTAEFNGMRFWNHILNKREDILGQNVGPYIACQNNKWVQVKDIDWSFYVDDGWDEGINCSKFRTRNILEKVQRELKKAEKEHNISLACPLFPEKLGPLKDKYGDLAPRLINDKGHSSIK